MLEGSGVIITLWESSSFLMSARTDKALWGSKVDHQILRYPMNAEH
jgi:hypothetical protein